MPALKAETLGSFTETGDAPQPDAGALFLQLIPHDRPQDRRCYKGNAFPQHWGFALRPNRLQTPLSNVGNLVFETVAILVAHSFRGASAGPGSGRAPRYTDL